MENEEKTLSPRESLRVIRETIDLARHGLRENGFHFRLWGWLVVLASLGQYYLQVSGAHRDPYVVWAIMPAIGVPVAAWYEWRRGRRVAVQNIVRDWYGLIWLGFFISLLIGLFWSVRLETSPVPVILTLMGFATFMSGVLLRFRPLLWGGAAAWAGALTCIFLPGAAHALVMAAATALGYLVPGYWLDFKARSRDVQRA
jgi:hypothetical protein